MPPSASAQRYAINQVVGITGVTDIQATKLLRQTRYNPEQAIDLFFNSAEGKSGTKSSLNALFDKYRDPANDEDDKFGIEGSMAYFADLEVKIDEITCLGIAEICKCPAMGEFTREGFVNGWMELEYVHPRETSCTNAPDIAKQKSAAKSLRRAIPTEPDTFRRVYRYCFLLSRMQGQRNVLFDIAVEQWRLFFSAQSGGIEANTATTPWLDWWIEFLDERGKKPVNKDLWEQFEVFLRKAHSDETFSWYDSEGAWPGVIDDFIAWVKVRRDGNKMEIE